MTSFSGFEHCPKFMFADNSYAQFLRFFQLAARFFACGHIIGFLTHTTADVTANRFDFLWGLVPRHGWQCSGQNKRFSGERQARNWIRRNFVAVWLDPKM